MVSKNKPVWPPPGWEVRTKTKNGRKVKYYINSKTHQKLYSKPAVLRYVSDGCVSNEMVAPDMEHAKKSSGNLVEANDVEWLPTGWITETRIRKSGSRIGTEYKCYIDPSTGAAFYSKPEVMRYLGSKQCVAGSSRQYRIGSRQSSRKRLMDSPKPNLEPTVSQIPKTHVQQTLSSRKLKTVTERTVDEELPSGWIKKTRIKMLGNKVVRRYSFYYDPASRLVFCSKLDVLRYLETGEISRHAFQRKNGSSIGEDSANGKTSTSSGKREVTPKSRTRKHLVAGKTSGGHSFLALPEAGRGENAEGKIKTRSSARARHKQSTLSSELASSSLEMVVEKPLEEKLSGTQKNVCMTKDPLSDFNDAGATFVSLDKSEPSSAPPKCILSEEGSVALAVQDCSNGKIQTGKRKSNDKKLHCVPIRSSKRLAGGDAEVVFHPFPIEHALRATNRKSSRTNPNHCLESVLNDSQEKNTSGGTHGLDDHSLQATSRKPSRTTKPILSLESSSPRTKGKKNSCVASRSPKRLAGGDAEVVLHPFPIEDAGTQDWNDHVSQATCPKPSTTKHKPSTTKHIPSLELVPNEVLERYQDFGKQELRASEEEKHPTPDAENVLGTQGETLHRIDDLPSQEKHCTLDVYPENVLTSEEEMHSTVDAENVLATPGEPLNTIDDVPSQEKRCTLDVYPEIVLATKGESSNIDDLTSQEEKHRLLDVRPETVLAAHVKASNKIDDALIPKDVLLVDVDDLQLEQAPPGFSENTKVEMSSVTIKQSFGHPTDTLGSKVENTSRGQPIQEEKLSSNERETEKPQSEFGLSSPLWSDPCLEFAFKTLTGALPFDDNNLAIHDYIQHQLRTSDEINQCHPSAPTVGGTKIVPRVPEAANFPNSNSPSPPDIKQVKNK